MDFYEVKQLNKVKTTHYKEGDFFKTSKSVGILINGKIQTLPLNLNEYVKKKDVEKLVKEMMGKENKSNE